MFKSQHVIHHHYFYHLALKISVGPCDFSHLFISMIQKPDLEFKSFCIWSSRFSAGMPDSTFTLSLYLLLRVPTYTTSFLILNHSYFLWSSSFVCISLHTCPWPHQLFKNHAICGELINVSFLVTCFELVDKFYEDDLIRRLRHILGGSGTN